MWREWGRITADTRQHTAASLCWCLHMRAYSNTEDCTDHIRCKKQCYCCVRRSLIWTI
ncbi:hypothetical protein QBC45DRAFT_412718 [Copromyces sp. CBS 386.78]|nr:hypothetical protein QBC45DRAFT_412718 [Copromyces sp. CBS 386.78]